MRSTVILFDIDGTLVTCGGAGRRAMEAAFLDRIGRGDVCNFSFNGATDRAIARRGLEAAGVPVTAEAVDALLERYLEHLGRTLSDAPAYRVLRGVVELLDRIEGTAGLAVGLGTGNVERGARAKLARGGIAERFTFGGFGDDHEERARLLEAGAARGAARLGVDRTRCRVVVVGDTPRDVEAARAIGAEAIGVATGGERPEVLLAHGARAAFEDLSDPSIVAILLA